MGAAVGRGNVINERVDVLLIAVVILQGDFHQDAVLHALRIDRIREKNFLVAVEVAHKFPQATFKAIIIFCWLLAPFVAENNADPLVEVGHLPQAMAQSVCIKVAGVKNAVRVFGTLHIGQELDGCAGTVSLTDDLQVIEVFTALILLLIDFSILIDGDGQVTGKSIDHGGANTVQAAGHFVAAAAELAAGVQHGEAYFNSRSMHLGMDTYRETAAIVLHGNGTILMERHVNALAIAGKRLVDGVVHNFVYQMMQTARIRGANVHSGALTHCLEAFQHLNVVFIIGLGDHGYFLNLLLDLLFQLFVSHTTPRSSCDLSARGNASSARRRRVRSPTQDR